MAGKPTAAQKVAVTQKALAQKAAATQAAKKINIVQSQFGSIGVNDFIKAKQQELSEKFGIPTFDTKGNISTVPQTRPLDTSISVGTGRFTESAFKKSLDVLINQTQQQFSPFTTSAAGLSTPLTAITEFLFPKQDLSDLTEEQRKQIQGIDEEIKKLNEQIARAASAPQIAGTGFEQANLGSLIGKRDELERTKSDLLRRYRASSSLIKEIQEQQQVLVKLNTSQQITEQLKDKINLEIANASSLLEKLVREGLEIPKDIVKQFQLIILESTRILKKEIDETQKKEEGILDGLNNALAPFAFLSDIFNNIFNPPFDEQVKRMMDSAKATVEAARRLA